jgi:hypothetical protein
VLRKTLPKVLNVQTGLGRKPIEGCFKMEGNFFSLFSIRTNQIKAGNYMFFLFCFDLMSRKLMSQVGTICISSPY